MGNTLTFRNQQAHSADLEARNRDTRTFVESFVVNNQELRGFGLFNGHGRPHYFKKARVKKTKFNKLAFDLKNDRIDILEEESLYFKVVHSVPVRVTVTFMCSTHIKDNDVQIYDTGHTAKRKFAFKMTKEVEESEIIVDMPENFYLNFLKLKMKDPNVSSCYISIKEDGVSVGMDKPDEVGVNVGLKPNKTLFTVLNKVLFKDDRLYHIKQVYNVNDDLEVGNKGVSQSMHVKSVADCSICLTHPVNTLMLPCRHYATCFTCTQTLHASTNKCPICREIVLDFVKVYAK